MTERYAEYAVRVEKFTHSKQWIDAAVYMLGQINKDGCQVVLDYGCGSGDLADMMARAGHSVYAVDKQDLRAKFGTNVNWMTTNEFWLLNPRPKFDVITMSFVVGHIQNPIVLIENLQKVALPQASLFVTIPSNGWRRLHWVTSRLKGYKDDPTIVKMWGLQELIDTVAKFTSWQPVYTRPIGKERFGVPEGHAIRFEYDEDIGRQRFGDAYVAAVRSA